MKNFRRLLVASLLFVLLFTVIGPVLYEKRPGTSELVVTEIMVKTKKHQGKDAFEYIELYNNSTKNLQVGDYMIRYENPKSKLKEDERWHLPKIQLEKGKSIVVWLTHEGNRGLDVKDFNEYYNTHLIEETDLIRVESSGLANQGERLISIETNVGEFVNKVGYNQGNESIHVSYMHMGFLKFHRSKHEAPTPGRVNPSQLPFKKIKMQDGSVKPTYKNITSITSSPEMSEIPIQFEVFDDNVKSVQLFYKTNRQKEKSVYLMPTLEEKNRYGTLLQPPEYIGASKLTYYIVISDGTNRVKSKKSHITIQSSTTKEALRLYTPELLSGEQLIRVASEEGTPDFFINDMKQEGGIPSMEHEAYLAFDVIGTNLYFKNGVTIGSETIETMDDTLKTYETYTVPIDARYFQVGEALQVSIRSGNKFSPFATIGKGSRDEFYVKNVRLILADGTTFYDEKYGDSRLRLSSKKGEQTRQFTFDVPPAFYRGVAYQWDTKEGEGGTYVLKVKKGEDVLTKEVVVDNVAPVITTNIKEEMYKGTFVIEGKGEDPEGTETELQVTLDGLGISLPYQTSSVSLQPGSHQVSFVATDKAGNTSEKNVVFTTSKESPVAPEKISPENRVKDLHVPLALRVEDPTEDDLHVTFLKGNRLVAGESREVKVFENVVDREPPNFLAPQGEEVIGGKDVARFAKVDAKGYSTRSKEGFPYHRFEVKVGEHLEKDEQIKIKWVGSSLKGRKVSMYAWNSEEVKWDLLTAHVAEDSGSFTLESFIDPTPYVFNGVAYILVQDEISVLGNDYDYSFVWMSDTQYYAEHYPLIQQTMAEWVVNNRESYNIQYVFHTGDLVDESYEQKQWQEADSTFRLFDTERIPYGVLAGNHDVDHKTDDYSAYAHYFGKNRFLRQKTYGDSYLDNKGHYDLVSVQGNDYVMVYMGWGIGEKEIEWVNGVLEQYADRIAILNVHEYLLRSGVRSAIGEELFEKVVVPNHNVRMVLGGHYYDSETLKDDIDDNGDGKIDRRVYQLLANYQGAPQGGGGYMRLFLVNQSKNRIDVKTYSPFLNDWNFYDPEFYPNKDEFTMKLPLQPKEKLVKTDYFEVSVYENEILGVAEKVPSGEIAHITYPNLKSNTTYGWYALIQDDYQGQYATDVWTFHTENLPEKKGGEQVP